MIVKITVTSLDGRTSETRVILADNEADFARQVRDIPRWHRQSTVYLNRR